MWLLPSCSSFLISGLSVKERKWLSSENLWPPSQSFSSSQDLKTLDGLFSQDNKLSYLHLWHKPGWMSCIDKPSLHSEVLQSMYACHIHLCHINWWCCTPLYSAGGCYGYLFIVYMHIGASGDNSLCFWPRVCFNDNVCTIKFCQCIQIGNECI